MMEWLECTVPAPEEPEELCLRLESLGVEGMCVESEKDFRSFLENNRACWDYVDEELERRFAGASRIRFWLPRDAAGHALLARLRGVGLAVDTAVIAEEDWANNWRQYYRPIPVGERLTVVPAWEEAPGDGRVPLRLDPGLIFGTGSHPTTRMCLELLETLVRPGARVLDLGCGSGILAIGALVLGAASAVGCDIDPKAPAVAESNAALNGLGRERLRVYAGDVLTDGAMRAALSTGYDIVLANIVADVIIPLAPHAGAFLAEGGSFVCSGIIQGRQEEVRAALARSGFSVAGHICQEEWHCFHCKRDILLL